MRITYHPREPITRWAVMPPDRLQDTLLFVRVEAATKLEACRKACQHWFQVEGVRGVEPYACNPVAEEEHSDTRDAWKPVVSYLLDVLGRAYGVGVFDVTYYAETESLADDLLILDPTNDMVWSTTMELGFARQAQLVLRYEIGSAKQKLRFHGHILDRKLQRVFACTWTEWNTSQEPTAEPFGERLLRSIEEALEESDLMRAALRVP